MKYFLDLVDGSFRSVDAFLLWKSNYADFLNPVTFTCQGAFFGENETLMKDWKEFEFSIFSCLIFRKLNLNGVILYKM